MRNFSRLWNSLLRIQASDAVADPPLSTPPPAPTVIPHHEAFAGLPLRDVVKPIGFGVDFLGCRYRLKYVEGIWPPDDDKELIFAPHPLPPFDEEYFEWIDLLESIRRARGRYVMIELGAGYGRWSVRAARALGLLNPDIPYSLIAVEAEPTHFAWLREHFDDNGLDPSAHDLMHAAVSCTSGTISFNVGKPSACYGQSIAGSAKRSSPSTGRENPAVLSEDQLVVADVPTIPLRDILRRYTHVDLIDCDIQGHEAEVFGCSMDALTAQVRRVHIGTHSTAIEEELRRLFGRAGWRCRADYGCGGTRDTPYGPITFEDGVQTWVNARFE